MSRNFAMIKDNTAQTTHAMVFSDDKYSATLATTTDTTLTVPVEHPKYVAIFSYEPGSTVWVANNTTAAVPAGASFAAVSSELNPVAREVAAGDVLHFISPDTSASVGVTFYYE